MTRWLVFFLFCSQCCLIFSINNEVKVEDKLLIKNFMNYYEYFKVSPKFYEETCSLNATHQKMMNGINRCSRSEYYVPFRIPSDIALTRKPRSSESLANSTSNSSTSEKQSPKYIGFLLIEPIHPYSIIALENIRQCSSIFPSMKFFFGLGHQFVDTFQDISSKMSPELLLFRDGEFKKTYLDVSDFTSVAVEIASFTDSFPSAFPIAKHIDPNQTQNIQHQYTKRYVKSLKYDIENARELFGDKSWSVYFLSLLKVLYERMAVFEKIIIKKLNTLGLDRLASQTAMFPIVGNFPFLMSFEKSFLVFSGIYCLFRGLYLIYYMLFG